jgi:geranylgeranylglycerol-phosphate geranylgeranyltransferase
MSNPLAVIVAGLQLTRPGNCLMSAMGVWLGAAAAIGWIAPPLPRALICAMACSVLLTAGGNTLNDCGDAEIDRINHPHRPIPSGRITKITACVLAVGELAVGLTLGVIASMPCGLLALLAVVLLALYEGAGLKSAGLPGNFIISLLTGLLFIIGGTAVGNGSGPMSLALLAFLATMGREIVKDIEDIPGDTPRRTWPMRVGIRRARRDAAACFVAAILLSPLPWWLGTLNSGYMSAVFIADLMFIKVLIVLFGPAQNAARAAKLAMFAVLAAFLIGVWP